jgi:cytochrome c oxidase subunit 4
MSDHAHDGSHDHEYHSHGKLYFSIFIALCALTLVSIAADLIHIPNRALLVGIVFAVAVSKALCVMLIFMHLKFERAWKYMLLAPTLILASTIPFALTPDIGTHYYVQTAPQIREFEAQKAAGAAGAGSHGHGADHGAEHKAEHGKQH